MGLGRWDRRNQRILEEQNENDEVVAPGAVTVYSFPALIKIGLITAVVAIVLVGQRELWSYGAAVVTVFVGGVLCLNLGRDVTEDAREWRRRRRSRRSD